MKAILLGKEVTLVPYFNEDELGTVFYPLKNNESFNHLGGIDSHVWQVLKSAAGFYIGCLTCSNYAKENEEPDMKWEPNMRDSDCYWDTREEAELAIIKHNYPVKF